MKLSRYWQIMLLLSVFAWRILIHGPLLTLASHNICLNGLINKETNWSQLVFKTRKRNQDPVPAAHEAGIPAAASGREFSKRLLLPAFCSFLFNQFISLADRHLLPPAQAPPFLPVKVFLKHCCLRR